MNPRTIDAETHFILDGDRAVAVMALIREAHARGIDVNENVDLRLLAQSIEQWNEGRTEQSIETVPEALARHMKLARTVNSIILDANCRMALDDGRNAPAVDEAIARAALDQIADAMRDFTTGAK